MGSRGQTVAAPVGSVDTQPRSLPHRLIRQLLNSGKVGGKTIAALALKG